ncbi:hypothetical protein [Tautonia marina]|uniref:hypothetical protein n=1 Tax=Tautonia marina TaxID=2653855 RepID=UPI001260693F|nr:hypothetical protein [Tautonia marina]
MPDLRRWGRWGGSIVALVGALMVGFSGLLANPTALIVDGERSWIDEGYRTGDRPIGNDLTGLFLPRFLWQSDHWRSFGTIPQWDPHGFAGRPNVGNPQAGNWYPPIWLAWSWGEPSALGWLTVGHLLWLGLGGVVLGRGVGLGPLAATVSGVVVMLNPYIIAQIIEGHLPHLWSVSWYPWTLVGALWLRKGQWTAGLLLPLGLACSVMTGHPQEGIYLGLVLAAWAAWDAFRSLATLRRHPLRKVRPAGDAREDAWRLGRWGLAFLLALGLSAVEWVPVLSARAWAAGPMGGEGGGGASLYHLWPSNLMQLISPRILGGPSSYMGRGNLWETMLSVGWAPLVLLVLGVAAYPDRRAVWGWFALMGMSLWFAGGRSLGLAAVVSGIPGLEAARVPARSLFVVVTAASVLAGMGMEVIGSVVDRRQIVRWARNYGKFLALVCFVVAGGVWASLVPEERGAQGRGIGRSLWFLATRHLAQDGLTLTTIAGVGAAFCWRVLRPERGAKAAMLMAGIVILELSLSTVMAVPICSVNRFLERDAVSEALDRHRPEGPFRVRARDTFYSDLHAWRDGIEKTNIGDLFQIRHAAEVTRPLYPVFQEPEAPFPRHLDADLANAILDCMGVALLVSDRPPRLEVGPVIESGRRGGARFELTENPGALPRAWVVPEVDVVNPSRTLERLAEVDPRSVVVMTTDPMRGIAGARQPFTPVEYRQEHPDRIILRVTTEAPGLMVVADTWMPGWQATLNGRAVPLDRGDHAFRVVALPDPGNIEVVMRYHAPGLAIGGILSSGAGVVLMVIGLRTLVQRVFRRWG